MALVVKTNVVSLVKELNKSKGRRAGSVAEDFVPALDAKMKKLVEDAVERAHGNNRRTVMGRDV